MNTTTVSTEIKERVSAKLVECIALAQQKYGMMFEFPTVIFRRLGIRAGLAWPSENKIELNSDFFQNGHLEDMINQTTPHEMAHIVTRKVYGKQEVNGRRKSHGTAWQSVMKHCFNLDPNRCHKYNIDGVRLRNTLKFEYTCSCNTTFVVSKNRHHKIQGGKRYKCLKCQNPIYLKSNPPQEVPPMKLKSYIDDIVSIPMPKILTS